jgi:CRP/FNR family transcriptional regulator
MNENAKKFFQDNFSILPLLSLSDQQKLIDGSNVLKMKKGEQMHDVTSSCNGIMLIRSGQLRAYMLSEDGKEITLYRLLPKDVCVLTSSCLFNNIDINMNIETEKDTEVIIASHKVLNSLRKEYSIVDRFILDIVAQRFSEVMWVMEKVVFSPMLKRVSECLADHYALSESPMLAITHSELANDLGSAREVVTRLLDYLQGEGVIRQFRGKIEITDIKKLREYYD